MLFPPFGRGGLAFQLWEWALWLQLCAGPGFFRCLYLSVVTKVAPVGARRLRWEVHICLSKGQAVNRFSF
ncbi:hypothetical protein DEN96_26845 [Escherichia coli]|nr:hypothetical protein AW070_24540 [Escherichia coli]QCH64517.1 hypothetical protein CAX06_026015 [Escherichia coli O91:H21]TFX59736.1 hypothetical protein DEO02_24680 [Escherichia coli]TFX70524.1 hypothetical protein DEO00_24690 [Escherichia coli]TFX74477.1 hypothetical protein DEN99_24975 [Escherichia coli]